MKQLVTFLSLILLINVSVHAQKKIFNGKDLTGWTIHGTEKWYVANGELVCESGPDSPTNTKKKTTPAISERHPFQYFVLIGFI